MARLSLIFIPAFPVSAWILLLCSYRPPKSLPLSHQPELLSNLYSTDTPIHAVVQTSALARILAVGSFSLVRALRFAHTSTIIPSRIVPPATIPTPPRYRKPSPQPPALLLPLVERHLDKLMVVVDPYRSCNSPWTVLAFCPRCRHRRLSHHQAQATHPPIMDPTYPSLLRLLLLDFEWVLDGKSPVS